jgi:hypothetical protein
VLEDLHNHGVEVSLETTYFDESFVEGLRNTTVSLINALYDKGLGYSRFVTTSRLACTEPVERRHGPGAVPCRPACSAVSAHSQCRVGPCAVPCQPMRSAVPVRAQCLPCQPMRSAVSVWTQCRSARMPQKSGGAHACSKRGDSHACSKREIRMRVRRGGETMLVLQL